MRFIHKMPGPVSKRRKLQHVSGKHGDSDTGSVSSDSNQYRGSRDGGFDNGAKQQDGTSNRKFDAGSLEEESGEIVNPAKTKSIPVQRAKLQQHLNGAFTGELYKSNIFKLQVDELLEQVKPDLFKAETSIATLLRTVKRIVEAIPQRDPVSVRLHCKATVELC